MSEALVNPDILKWARERANLAIDGLADKLGLNSDKLLSWETGEARPSFSQAQKVARIVHIPFGYLFLSTPPIETIPIPDFRTVGDYAFSEPSAEFRDLLSDVIRKWQWFKDYVQELKHPSLPFVGKFKTSAAPEDVATDISTTLDLDDNLRESVRSWEEFLRKVIERADERGILIMRSGIVGNNTHRPLFVDEFRGFNISDSFAPLVFINGKDAKAAQIFTLAHELAHLWIGESGISNVSLGKKEINTGNNVEKYCNIVAAELLVPKTKFLSAWNTGLNLDENAEQLVRYFRVSNIVIARRALDLGLTKWSNFMEFYEKQKDRWHHVQTDKDSGGDFHLTLRSRNGAMFSRAVLSSAYEGRLLFRDAAKLLGINVGVLEKFAQKIKVK
jgi:Zn-dependent peptidase ImmA (M78 family)/DNA-binding XRE family transcriptional regulator